MIYKRSALLNGVVWSAIDKFGIVAAQLILEVVLARLLLPSDYGAMGMVAIFIAIGQVFTDGGFSNALIQKKDRTEIDFSTVFFFSLLVSSLIYFLIYLASPLIAGFYELPLLEDIIKVLGLTIIANSLILIHRTKLNIALNFKVQAKFSLLAVVISGIIGLYLAWNGHGVWSLVYQSLSLSILNVVFFWARLRWVPKLIFSKRSFDELFYFGSKLLVAALLQAIYNNSYAMLIGKKLSARDLGVYTKSNQFTLMPVSMLTSVIQRVIYPFMTTTQDDDDKLFIISQSYTKLVALTVFPIFLTVAVLAKPLVNVVFTEKWDEMAPVLRILAISYMFYPIIINNMFLFQVKNKTGLFLKIEIITKITGIIILLASFKFGLEAMCVGLLIQQLLQLFITSSHSSRLLKKPAFSQLLILTPFLAFSSFTFFSGLLILYFIDNYYLQLLFGFGGISLGYFIYYYFFIREELSSLLGLFKKTDEHVDI